MKCADPILCYTNELGRRQFRHFSLASLDFKKNHQAVFDCGTCVFCRKKKSFELAARCVLHASLYKDNCFLTLTYDEKKEGYHNELQYRDIQLFKKNLRQHVKRTYGTRIEIFNVHEYGKAGKKHWHLIVFNYCPADKKLYTTSNGNPLYTSEEISSRWPHGFHTIGDVSTATAMYQAQYMEKDIRNGNLKNSKKSKSNHSGIGRSYFYAHFEQLLSLAYIPINGRKLPLPRYFQKLAHRHWCHFYAPAAFKSTHARKAIYRPFKNESPNRRIADLWIQYKARKEELLETKKLDWQDFIDIHLTENTTPDFIKSGENYIYDLNNKQKQEKF